MKKRVCIPMVAVLSCALALSGCGGGRSDAESVEEEIMAAETEEEFQEAVSKAAEVEKEELASEAEYYAELYDDYEEPAPALVEGDPLPGEEGYRSDGQNDDKRLSPGDYPCDPMVYDSDWADGYVQICDIILQEGVGTIDEAVNKVLESELGFKTDYRPDDFYNWIGTHFVTLSTPNGESLKLYYCQYISDVDDSEVTNVNQLYEDVVEIGGLRFQAVQVETGGLLANSYLARGVRLDGGDTGFTYDTMDELLGDNIIKDDYEHATMGSWLADNDMQPVAVYLFSGQEQVLNISRGIRYEEMEVKYYAKNPTLNYYMRFELDKGKHFVFVSHSWS